MNAHTRQTLSKLREVRDALGTERASRNVEPRYFLEPGTPAWDAFVKVADVPGRSLPRKTMLDRVNLAIDTIYDTAWSTDPTPIEVERHWLRRLTPEGIELAKRFLADLRANPAHAAEPPSDLLHDKRYAVPFEDGIEVESRTFHTRWDAAEYLAPRLKPISHLVADHAEVWSWLGMFFFTHTAPRDSSGEVKLSPETETFVVDRNVSRSLQRRFRHYLWIAWRIHEQHGEAAKFLLDRNLTQWGEIEDRTLANLRTFNSVGVVPLILHLYTQGAQQKRGFRNNRGGLRHLVRVLTQMERTHDVYGMEPEALLKILPEEFRQWDE